MTKTASVALLLWVIASSGSSLAADSPRAQAISNSAGLSIKLDYPTRIVHMRQYEDVIAVEIQSENGLNLNCIQGYRDFAYSLTTADGATIRELDGVRSNPPPDHSSYSGPFSNGQNCGSPVDHYSFGVALRWLFPALKPGTYTLHTSFDPKNRVVPSFALPPVTFTYAPE